jgi:hypothetical protein
MHLDDRSNVRNSSLHWPTSQTFALIAGVLQYYSNTSTAMVVTCCWVCGSVALRRGRSLAIAMHRRVPLSSLQMASLAR